MCCEDSTALQRNPGSPLLPVDFGDAPDPCGPDDHGFNVDKAACLVKGEGTHDIIARSKLRPSALPKF